MNEPKLLTSDEVDERIESLGEWTVESGHQAITRTFSFDNFHQTMAFVNALAWIAHSMDHHPDFQVGYKTCAVTYTTHSAGGITPLDVEAARRCNDLLSS
jgi:4a-hydroxytetrahydrobiopterin dehydratase